MRDCPSTLGLYGVRKSLIFFISSVESLIVGITGILIETFAPRSKSFFRLFKINSFSAPTNSLCTSLLNVLMSYKNRSAYGSISAKYYHGINPAVSTAV